VVGVTICNFNLWPKKDRSGRFKVPLLSRWRMQEQHSAALGMSQVQYVFLELPKYAAGDDPQTLVDKWAYFFREAKNLNVVPPALSEGPFRDALEVTRTATFTPEEWEAYERAKMAEQDARGALADPRVLRRRRARSMACPCDHGALCGRGRRAALTPRWNTSRSISLAMRSWPRKGVAEG
jgi:hypothetical protein